MLPFAALVFDFVENGAIITLLATYPQQNILMARVASVAGIMKWAMVVVGAAALVMVVLLGRIKPCFMDWKLSKHK